ncbi:MAG: N-acetyl-gamma-glutamyl-phosphate reductase [Phycisphaerales bacterium]|nr:N-acetyl-gamma-glutamyl-phosphate reductase [Phycisphaerales bacterium]
MTTAMPACAADSGDAPAIHVGILGATGYGAGELLRLLTQHPHARVVTLVSSSAAGSTVTASHPHLRGFYDAGDAAIRLAAEADLDALSASGAGVVFSALPHGESAAALVELAKRAESRRLPPPRLIDLSGDLRLRDLDSHRRFYPESPDLPEQRSAFEYGMPELFRERIRGAQCIANPGCLASAAILAGAPLLTDERVRGDVVVDAMTGSSGSGRTPRDTTHHPTRHSDFRAYKPLAHQHEGEILQAWGDPAGRRVQLGFVAHSMAVSRGVFVTLHLSLSEPISAADLEARYRAFYAGSPFVRIVQGTPTLQDVVGSNFCDIAVTARGRQVVALAALDNLVKGMAGAAIQNMNLMFGLPEQTGLWTPALRPV